MHLNKNFFYFILYEYQSICSLQQMKNTKKSHIKNVIMYININNILTINILETVFLARFPEGCFQLTIINWLLPLIRHFKNVNTLSLFTHLIMDSESVGLVSSNCEMLFNISLAITAIKVRFC